MKRFTRTLPVFLAAALQLMPLVRNLFVNPATGNTFAFILRWGIGTGATLGAYDACSGGTQVYFPAPTSYSGTVGTYFTNNITMTNNQDLPGAYCGLSNSLGQVVLLSGNSTTTCMPPGLTFKFIDQNNNTGTIYPIYGSMFGTNTSAVTNFTISVTMGLAGYGSTTTNISFTILPASSVSPPVITNQPVSLTNNVGGNATFSVTAGTAPLHYQWYFNTNTAQVNATNTSFTVTNIQLTNAGTYSVIITNSSGSVTSSFARITVWLPPVITNQPVSITNLAGSSPAFSVTAGGVPAVGYQWKFNTNTVLTGATGTALTLTNARASQAGTYCVIVTNSAGSVTNFATLVVTNPLPAAFTPTAPVKSATSFQFTFTTVAGLTNTVLTNGLLSGGTWNVFTNIPPTPTPTPIVISNAVSGSGSLFYRVEVMP